MGCKHKFEKYLYLNDLGFEPTTLIIGTFNPSCIENNEAEWFYGRTKNNYFWDVLPRLYNESSLIDEDPCSWKNFCKKHKIAITDFIASIEDADINNPEHKKALERYSDKGIAETFKQFSFVDIVAILKAQPTIKNVYVTLSATGKFWGSLWEPIKEYSNANDIKAEFLLTPSGNARFQKKNKSIPLNDFIYSRWLEVFARDETSGDQLEIKYNPEWFQSGYYVYILTVTHKIKGVYYYIGQTGGRARDSARSPFYRQMGHFNTYSYKGKGTDAQLIKGLVENKLIPDDPTKSIRIRVEKAFVSGEVSVTAKYYKVSELNNKEHSEKRLETEMIELSLIKMFSDADQKLFNDLDKIGDRNKIENINVVHSKAKEIYINYSL